MKGRTILTVGLSLVLVLSFSAVAHAAFNDQIIKKDGGKISEVEVTGEDYEVVKYKIRGGGRSEQSISAAKVNRVEYAAKPPGYHAAFKSMKKSAFDLAAEQFKEVLSKTSDKPEHQWALQYCKFYIPKCLLNHAISAAKGQERMDSLKKAIEGFDKLLADFPKTRWYADALLGKGMAEYNQAIEAADKKLLENARKTYQALLEFCEERKYGGGMILQAKLKLASILVEMKDYNNAARQYKDIIRAANTGIDTAKSPAEKKEFREIRDEAQIWEIKCYILAKDYTTALAHIKSLANDRDASKKVKATCHSMTGNILLDKDKKPEKAVHEFLKVIVLFQAVADAQADARWGAARCFQALNAANPTDAVSKTRAKEHCKYIIKNYASARVRKDAEKMLEELDRRK